MFDLAVCFLTLENVGLMLTFITIGFLLRRTKKIPETSGKVLSLLTTLLFNPAYTMRALALNFTMDTIGEKSVLLLLGTVIAFVVIGFAFILSKIFGRSVFEKKSLIYAFAFPNYGYFGYPVVEGIFGTAALADMMVFCIPISILTSIFAYPLFASNGKVEWKKVLLAPMFLSVFIGAGIGLSGLQLPGFVTNVLSVAGNCMSPASMLLAGFVLAALPLKDLITGWRSYLYSAIRLAGIPAVFGGILFLLGLRDMQLLIPLLFLSLPLGLNLVVFPESFGYDARDNARMCFVSYLLAIAVLPITFTLIQGLSQLP